MLYSYIQFPIAQSSDEFVTAIKPNLSTDFFAVVT
jgi:hypothetical protein